MDEQTNTSREEGQKTVVAFIAGLLIGGLLVWVFATPNSTDEMAEDADNEASVVDSTNNTDNDNVLSEEDVDDPVPVPELPMGDGDIKVNDQPAGMVVVLGDVTFPNDEGWVGVRDYNNGELTGLLGVARWSREQGLIPTEVELLRATESGNSYAVVFYSESGDREFSLADDVQLEGNVAAFTAR